MDFMMKGLHAGGYDRGAFGDRRRVRGVRPLMAGQDPLSTAPSSARWEGFQWTSDNARKAKAFIARYPEGRQVSAVIPLLGIAQRQVGAETNTQGWLPIPVMEFVAKELDTSYIRVLEVATLHHVQPRPGRPFHVQVCGTTPVCCRARRCAACLLQARVQEGWHDRGWSVHADRVECLGACANAPMVQVNDDKTRT
jgi:NADH-quinone oxidoreductase subunit E